MAIFLKEEFSERDIKEAQTVNFSFHAPEVSPNTMHT